MANVNLSFPDYITAAAYKHRRVIINVIEAETATDGVAAAINRAKEDLIGLGKAIAGDAGSLEDTLANQRINAEKESGKTIFSIMLPLPNELTDTQSHDWTTSKGIIGTALGGIESNSVSNIAGKVSAGAFEAAELAAGALSPLGGGVSALGGMEIQQALGAMADSAGLRKPLADPGYFQNYTGSQPRTFDMSFDFVPRNANEAKNMIAIIMKLKEYSSPEKMPGGVSILAPHYFDIEISNEYISGLASMRGVVLQNIVVNYGADGAMQQFPDGTPKYIQLGLTFNERKMRTADYYRRTN